MTDRHKIANAHLSITGRLDCLSRFDWDADTKCRWAVEIMRAIGHILTLEKEPCTCGIRLHP